MTTIHITLPWPHSDLSPNGRVHWAVKAGAVSAARRYAYLSCMSLLDGRVIKQPKAARVEIEFYPPNKRHYDIDNLQARCKAYQDGVFEALCWNDKIVKSTMSTLGEVRQGGDVVYKLSWEE